MHEKRIRLAKKDMKRLLGVLESTDSNENLKDVFALYNKVIS
jgi:small nuclear ribonucleoprotein (snRNP)-like protein